VEFTMLMDDCEGVRIAGECQRTCTCASPWNSLAWREEGFVRALHCQRDPGILTVLFHLIKLTSTLNIKKSWIWSTVSLSIVMILGRVIKR